MIVVRYIITQQTVVNSNKILIFKIKGRDDIIYATIKVRYYQEHLRIPQSDLVLLEIVGRGNYGVVHKGIWKGRGNDLIVAIKQVYYASYFSPSLWSYNFFYLFIS